jgi:hypothetical protein
MSPEQCRGDDVDARSDLFSVGTVLYELLSGTRAFSGRNITEVSHRVLTAEPRDLTEFVENLPAGLSGVLRQAMVKSKEGRYASAAAMADALRAALRDGTSAIEVSDAASGSDRTVVLPPGSAYAAAAGVAIDDAMLDTIERRLARYTGPIARHLVRDAARRTNSIEALCETVARNISQATDRERFLAESPDGSPYRSNATGTRSAVPGPASISVPGTGGGSRPVSGFSDSQITRVEHALTRALGPIAKLLVKRALPSAPSEDALWERLAAHIERAADRDAFLRLQPGRLQPGRQRPGG